MGHTEKTKVMIVRDELHTKELLRISVNSSRKAQ